jgi:hypothetical protein
MTLSESLWLAQQEQISAANWPMRCSSCPCCLLEANNSKHNHCLCNLYQKKYLL